MNRSFEWWIRTAVLGFSHPCLVSRRLWYNTKRTASSGLAISKYYNYPHKIIFLAGMAMSATTWMKNLLARIPGYYTYSTPMPRHIAVNQNICDSAFKHVPKYGYALFKTHLNPTGENLECISRNGVERVLITYRDLRDVAIARYHRLMVFPKTPDEPHFVDYRAIGKEKAMEHNIDIIASRYVPWIHGWRRNARKCPEKYLFVRFENLKRDTNTEFRKVLQFYSINLSDEKIEKIIEASKGRGTMRSNIAAARILSGGQYSNFRSGKIGNWKNELSDVQIEKCKSLLGPALIELGYEKDLKW